MSSYYEVAAKWWADKLRKPAPGNFDMGEKEGVGSAAMLLGLMIAVEVPTPSENINQFEARLASMIRETCENDSFGRMTLDVDYVPCIELSSLAKECGVKANAFPWKTTMRIRADKVSVRCGYGAEEQVLFQEGGISAVGRNSAK